MTLWGEVVTSHHRYARIKSADVSAIRRATLLLSSPDLFRRPIVTRVQTSPRRFEPSHMASFSCDLYAHRRRNAAKVAGGNFNETAAEQESPGRPVFGHLQARQQRSK